MRAIDPERVEILDASAPERVAIFAYASATEPESATISIEFCVVIPESDVMSLMIPSTVPERVSIFAFVVAIAHERVVKLFATVHERAEISD